MEKIRIGIDLDHVIRDINRQIVKYYQKDIDENIDVDNIDYQSDVLNSVCKFNSRTEKNIFLYETYPLEIFGHAPQVEMFESRDLNAWIRNLTNQEKYDVEIFFFSMKEVELTIQSSYFFLSKIGSRVRKVIFPKSIKELCENGDIFITAYGNNAKEISENKKKVILIRKTFNYGGLKYADLTYNSFSEFLMDKDNLNKISNIINVCKKTSRVRSLWTYIKSLTSSLIKTKKE